MNKKITDVFNCFRACRNLLQHGTHGDKHHEHGKNDGASGLRFSEVAIHKVIMESAGCIVNLDLNNEQQH